MEIIHDAPTAASFIPLSTHQSQTPESFFDGPPVLYHHSPSAKLSIRSTELALAPILHKLFGDSSLPTNGSSPVVNGHTAETEDRELSIEGVDAWVTSERFILFYTPKSNGISIPYPYISLHAIERRSPAVPANLFLQILTQSPTFDDHDPDATISLSLTPRAETQNSASQPPETEAPLQEGSAETQTSSPTQELYAALSACANLHPDTGMPGSDDEDSGGGPNIMFEGDDSGEPFTTLGSGQQTALPPPMPGSGGWITADNVGEFFDENGNWRGQGEGQSLGEGAGSIRRREDEAEDVDGEEGGDDEVDDAGDGEETKWRRTG